MRLQDEIEAMIRDSGPRYHEFNPDSWIKEPWNAYSSLFFLVPVIFWAIKLKGRYRKYFIISILLPLLFLNGVGSTLYHAFRSSDLFMNLDWMPAFVMGIILSTFLWQKVTNNWLGAVFIILSFYAAGILGYWITLPTFGQGAGNVAYFFVGTCMLLPTIIYLFKTNFYKAYLIFLSAVFLIGALVFRSLDYPTPNPWPETLPQGTHFLWHISSAMAGFSLGYYLYFTQNLLSGEKPLK